MNTTTTLSRREFSPWLLAGLFGFAPHLVAVVVATYQRPGFDHRSQFISELGERGSNTAFVINFVGIVPTGLLLAAFGVGLVVRYRAHRLMAIAGALIALHGFCRVMAAFFPCDVGCRPVAPSLSQVVHNVSATIAFISLTAALFTTGVWLVKSKRGVVAVLATYTLGVAAVVAQGLLMANTAGGDVGLHQRVALGALQIWVAILAFHFIAWAPVSTDDA